MLNSLTCGSLSASSPFSGPRRTMSESFQTPTSMLPFSRKPTPPNICFSSTPLLRAGAWRIRSASAALKAIGHSSLAGAARRSSSEYFIGMGRKDRRSRKRRVAENAGHDQGRQGAGDSAPLRGRGFLVRPGRRVHALLVDGRYAPLAGAGRDADRPGGGVPGPLPLGLLRRPGRSLPGAGGGPGALSAPG